MKKVFAILLSIYAFLLLTTSCGDLFSSSSRSIVGTWGMVSGGIKEGGSFSSLEEKEGSYYKTMVFLEDGTFTEQCGDATATGTYEVKSSSIKYSYANVSGTGPAYFAIHKSGTWTYYFLDDDSFMLYDYASSTEVSMRLKMIE